MKTPNAVNKILGLEIIRFIASMAVLIWHYHHFFLNTDQPLEVIDTNQPFYNILFPFYISGAYGVITFWCLSGYIFFWKYSDQIKNKLITARRFAILRFSRLYPLHFATLLFVVVAQSLYYAHYDIFYIYQINDLKHFILQLFMASHWGLQDGLSFNGPIWSVSVEIIVYCLFFASIRYISNSFVFRVTLFLLAILAFKFLFHSEIIQCLGYFFLGGLVDSVQNRFKINKKFVTIAAVLALLAGIFTYNIINNAGLSFLVILPAVIYLLSEYFWVPGFMAKFVEGLGNLTYGIYLLHFPIQITIVLIYTYIGLEIPVYNPIFFLAFVFFTMLFARLVYIGFEMPCQSYLRKKLLKKPVVKENIATAIGV